PPTRIAIRRPTRGGASPRRSRSGGASGGASSPSPSNRCVDGCAPTGAQPFAFRSVAAPAREPAASPATATATAAALLLARLADVDLPATDVAAVQLRDGPACFARRAHLDEAEAARTARLTIGHDRGRLARPHLGEQRLELGAGGRKG